MYLCRFWLQINKNEFLILNYLQLLKLLKVQNSLRIFHQYCKLVKYFLPSKVIPYLKKQCMCLLQFHFHKLANDEQPQSVTGADPGGQGSHAPQTAMFPIANNGVKGLDQSEKCIFSRKIQFSAFNLFIKYYYQRFQQQNSYSPFELSSC